MHLQPSESANRNDPQVLRINRLIKERMSRNPSTRGKLEKVVTGPTWYRGLSASQTAAANDLNDCLRDDMEQRTTYRLARLLDRLGVYPRPTRKNIKLLMNMSRGSDVAFLWFLMELCYKTKSYGRCYDVNEQIILSSIFWLDLNPTLRELDHILPLPHISVAERARLDAIMIRKQRDDREKQEIYEYHQMKKNQPVLPLSPYFEKPIFRKPWRASQSILADYPDRPALLRPVPQDTALSTFWSRWFGSHDFTEGHRVATSVLYAEINNIFKSIKAANIPNSKVESMCLNHQAISEMEKSLKIELEVMKRTKLRELLTGNNRASEQRRKKLLEELDRMTAYFEAQFHDMAAKARIASTRNHLITGIKPNIICMQKIPDKFSSSDDELNCQKPNMKFGDLDEKFICPESGKIKNEFKKINVKLLEGIEPILPNCPDYTPEQMACGNCNFYDPKTGIPEQVKIKPRPSSVRQFLQLCGKLETMKNEKEESPAQSPSDSNNLKYFQLGSPNSTDYKFNYRQLFKQSNLSHIDDEKLRLKKAFVKALTDDCQYLNKVINCEDEVPLETVVKEAADQIYHEDSKILDNEYERLMHREKKKKINGKERLDFGREYYNAEDIGLMKYMLRKGLDKVGENPSYVLPTLPDVESVPYLVEWISYRYGKRYSKEELISSFEEATLFMENLAIIMKNVLVRVPTMNFRKYNFDQLVAPKFKQFVKKQRHHYKHLFLESLMELGRVFYSAMRPQLCGNQVLEKTFYAYMPAKFHDTGFSIIDPNYIKRIPIKRS